MPSHLPPDEPRVVRAHAFVLRDGRILVLEQAAGARWWETPGGTLEPGESPEDAVVREVLEETGVRIESPVLLRPWSYENRRGDVVGCCTYVAAATEGDVILSDEHARFDWLTVEEYAERYCPEDVHPTTAPWVRAFLAEMREDCRLLREWLAHRQPIAG